MTTHDNGAQSAPVDMTEVPVLGGSIGVGRTDTGTYVLAAGGQHAILDRAEMTALHEAIGQALDGDA